jgi:MYXO-CTERM domain-containing protein
MKLAKRRIDWFVVVTSVVFAVSCSGGGCGGCTTFGPIPGGYPPAKRAPNAVQVRVTPTALSFIEANPASLLGSLAGGASAGVVKFPVPSSCSGDPYVCCDSNHNAVQPCGPVDIDLNQHAGDPAVLTLAPQSGASQLNLVINSRIKTEMDLPFEYSFLSCGVQVDSTGDTGGGTKPYFTISAQIQFVQDAVSGTTRINANSVTVTNVDSGDLSLNGHDFGSDIACAGATAFLGFATSLITDQLASQIQSAINGATCKSCPSGDVAECGSSFATACTGGTCMEGNVCLQELGIDGRAKSVSLFGGLSPGTGGGIDMYEVAGGYATTDNSGIALGLLGGMEPAGTPRDLCGPATTEPALATITPSTIFQGNAFNGSNFDVGLGLHKSQLDALAYAGYNGGLFCLTLGHSTVSQLTTDTLGLVSRSLTHLVTENSPMAVGLRPQSPPTITLGKNTFMTDGMGNKTLDQPLLDIKFQALEIDFFAEVDQQWIRVFTVVTDVHLPVGLDAAMPGQLTPVLGNPMDAFTNISVKNSDAVTESPASLAGLFPSLLGIVLPQLSNGLSPISLPALGGLVLNITSVTSVGDTPSDTANNYLAIFANLAIATPMRPVKTSVNVLAIHERPQSVQKNPSAWPSSTPPEVQLQLGGNASDLEWQIKLDGGTWSAWSKNPRPTLSPRTFWLPGYHKAEVRARQAGRPETTDNAPVTVELPIGVPPRSIAKDGTGANGFHGQAGGASGCGCESGKGGAGSGALMALVILLVVAPLRRLRRRAARLGGTVWLAALACLPACDCGDKPCGSAACMPGEVAHAPGKWTSISGDDKRVMVATYDPQNGDLVVVDATNPQKLAYKVVDGTLDGETPTFDPSTYRGGKTDPGPDVGAWTSIAMSRHVANVAYQDRDAKTLKFASEDGGWRSHVVDQGGAFAAGEYANLLFDADGHPAIAYITTGNDDGAGHIVTNLQLARSGRTNPGSASDWAISTIASAPGTCAGLCSGGQVCVAGAAATDPQTCVTPGTCTPGCGSGSVCVNNACVTELVDPKVDDVATGTGLFVSLVLLPDGRLAAAYYDQVRRALVLSVETAKGSSQFMENLLDGNVDGADRGMWSSAVAAGDGTVHLAYQDALGDQLMYTSWNGTPGTPVVVDDGQRPGDRTHPVGSGNAIYLVNGTPAIAYQDGMTSDVYVATQSGTTWTTNPLAMGPLLDGFSIGATTAHGGVAVLAWDLRDPANDPPNGLQVMQP